MPYPNERGRAGGRGLNNPRFAALDRNAHYIIVPKGARKAACAMRPEAGRRWHP